MPPLSTEIAEATASTATAAEMSYAELQRLVDQAANFHLRTRPLGECQGRAVSVRSLSLEQSLHRMTIDQLWPDAGAMKSHVATGASFGSLSGRLHFIDADAAPRPDRDTPAIEWDRRTAARFVLRVKLNFDSGCGFSLFGTGRVFPVSIDGKMKWMAGAVAVITEATGVFLGLEGNCTWCGDLGDDGFIGHIMVRIRDPRSKIVSQAELPPLVTIDDPEPGVSYLSWIGQKAPVARLANYPSLTLSGAVRGLNIPVDQKLVHTDGAVVPGGFRAAPLRTGDVIALEIGFGREPLPRSPEKGNSKAPFQFEGVSNYSFNNRSGNGVAGAFTANVTEGRSVQVSLPGAPDEPALRFGFFGPVLCGTGCFRGLAGMLYGASGSVFNFPPKPHVISNWYVLRLYDPAGRFSAERKGCR